MLEKLEQIKIKWIDKINNALDNGVRAETLGAIGETIAKLEYNEIFKHQKPLDYDRVVSDVKEVVKDLPKDVQPQSEIIE